MNRKTRFAMVATMACIVTTITHRAVITTSRR
jgi:hypothetical protein